MAKNKRQKKSDRIIDSKPLNAKKEPDAFAKFLSMPNAKWLFFAVYLLVTIFLFRNFLFSDKMLFGSDTIPDGIYTRQYYKDFHAEFGGIPRWNPFILGGLPFIDAMHGDTFYPAAWLKFFMPLTRALGYKLILHVFFAGILMYLFMRTLKLRRDAAFLGGLMYMLAPSFVTWLYGGHDAKMYVIALLPLAFTALEAGMNKAKFYKFVGLGTVMGFLILTSHVQMAYYAYWAIGLYFIFRLFSPAGKQREEIPKKAAFFLIAVIIALTIGAVQLLPSYKFTTSQSVRAGAERTGYEYATSWSMHMEEAAGMIVPSFPGFYFLDGLSGRQGNYYWGKNPFKLNTEYHGIFPILFAVMALIFYRDRLKWFLLGLAVLSLIYALGANTPFYRIFYALVPGVKNFRAPSMIIFLFCFAFVVMASQFISALLNGKISLKKGDKRLLYAVGIIVGAALLISVMGRGFFELWQNIFYREILDNKINGLNANIPYFTRDLWRVVLLAVISLMGIWMYLSGKIRSSALVVLLALIIFIDGIVVNSYFIKVLNPRTYKDSAPDQTVRELQKKMAESKMPFRVLGMFSGKKSSNYYAMFGIHVADGQHNNELQTYELFKGGRYFDNFKSFWIDRNELNPDGLSNNNFLKVAGAKYIVIPIGQGRTQLLENRYALDRAFIVNDFVTVKNDALAIEMLKDSSFDPQKKVIITGDISESSIDSGDESIVNSFSYIKDGIEITADFYDPGFLVLAENFVPYWAAKVDGKRVDIHRAYGTFMTVWCPEGKHEISFTFRSSPYETGKKLTMASLVFVIISFAATGIMEQGKRREKT
ncbi:MAG TPA: hypothetical protein ENH82_02790 [bacterium]|nr:hypothetical protein [bacterium]